MRQDRVIALDALRGFALCGILLVIGYGIGMAATSVSFRRPLAVA